MSILRQDTFSYMWASTKNLTVNIPTFINISSVERSPSHSLLCWRGLANISRSSVTSGAVQNPECETWQNLKCISGCWGKVHHKASYTQACQPWKSLLRFLGSMACWMSRLTCPPTLSTAPSSTPFSFSCSRSSTRSATLLKLWLSLQMDRSEEGEEEDADTYSCSYHHVLVSL